MKTNKKFHGDVKSAGINKGRGRLLTKKGDNGIRSICFWGMQAKWHLDKLKIFLKNTPENIFTNREHTYLFQVSKKTKYRIQRIVCEK